MFFSRSVEYAVRALTRLARQPSGTLLGAREISEAEGVPMPFLWKVLQVLARRKLVRSFKGARGGYELARPARQITLLFVVTAIDGDRLVRNCLLGLPQCNEEQPCPLHETWKRIRAEMTRMLEQTTLADLARIASRTDGKPV